MIAAGDGSIQIVVQQPLRGFTTARRVSFQNPSSGLFQTLEVVKLLKK